MNIFNKVTLQSLKKNRTRTFVTIIGIMLSTALICAVTTSFASVRQYAISYFEHSEGKWHGMEKNIDNDSFKKIVESDEVKDKAVLSYIGYAEIDSTNSYKPYLYISGFQEDEQGIAPIRIISGRMPENSSEILLPEHLADNGEVYYSEGDVLKLEIGDRVADTDELINMDTDEMDYALKDSLDLDSLVKGNLDLINSYIFRQDTPYVAVDDKDGKTINAEKLNIKDTREYTVVGFYMRPEFEDTFAPGYTALTVPDKYTEDTYYTVFYRMKHMGDIYDFMKENGFEDNGMSSKTHSDLLMFRGVSKYASFYGMIYGLMAVVIGLIMFGSIMLIYNAFSISVSERTKQFGLLSSIGATKKQLRKMVRFEATTLSFIGIPLGIGLGILGMWVTFLAIGSRFTFFSEDDYREPMRVCVSPTALIAASIIAFVTIRISAWIPSVRATKITAVEAIRQNSDIKQPKHVKTPKIIFKVFGLSGMLAHKYFKRSKKKYRATIISLFMSIVLFISSYAFTSYLVNSVNDAYSTFKTDYIYSLYNNGNEEEETKVSPDELLRIIKNTEHITGASYYNQNPYNVYIDEKYLTKDFIKTDRNDNNTMSSKDGKRTVGVNICFVDDETYNNFVKEHGLSENEFMNAEDPVGIAFDNSFDLDTETGRMVRHKVFKSDRFEAEFNTYDNINGYYLSETHIDGKVIYRSEEGFDSIEVDESECSDEVTIKVGKVLDEEPFFFNYYSSCIIYPYSAGKTIFGEQGYESSGIEFSINSDDIYGGFDALEKVLNEKEIYNGFLINYAASAETSRNMVVIIKVFAYGFIVLISLIAAANVFNTITTNINLRRREFAMLKSVGMTAKGMRKMLNFECILYGTKALLYGLPVSAIVTYLIYISISRGIDTYFSMPWGAVGIAVLSVFLVVFATMMYSMSKIKKDNPIDALKNENL
ncbi:ABC transporter permease [Ruminococcus sp.]|uniref:ABC transporter permease n=1 Tax=Ruminococcus sp. TaxID=41978 RepID=UPI0025D33B4D|nr:ABC transporter permease [Ruminococcus sp.]MCR4639988.1 ABC transporter permease [Ruminococcus sp.]